MNWQQLISNKRFGLEHLHELRKDDRTEFQRDYDRLVFSAPFRRLQNKFITVLPIAWKCRAWDARWGMRYLKDLLKNILNWQILILVK